MGPGSNLLIKQKMQKKSRDTVPLNDHEGNWEHLNPSFLFNSFVCPYPNPVPTNIII